jgi:hypothetical protein
MLSPGFWCSLKNLTFYTIELLPSDRELFSHRIIDFWTINLGKLSVYRLSDHQLRKTIGLLIIRLSTSTIGLLITGTRKKLSMPSSAEHAPLGRGGICRGSCRALFESKRLHTNCKLLKGTESPGLYFLKAYLKSYFKYMI